MRIWTHKELTNGLLSLDRDLVTIEVRDTDFMHNFLNVYETGKMTGNWWTPTRRSRAWSILKRNGIKPPRPTAEELAAEVERIKRKTEKRAAKIAKRKADREAKAAALAELEAEERATAAQAEALAGRSIKRKIWTPPGSPLRKYAGK